MNIFKEKYYESKLSAEEVEKAYEIAQKEIESDNYSKGLMAKAKSKAEGDQQKAEAIYLDLRTKKILDEKIEEEWKKFKSNGKVGLNKVEAFILGGIVIFFLSLLVLAYINR